MFLWQLRKDVVCYRSVNKTCLSALRKKPATAVLFAWPAYHSTDMEHANILQLCPCEHIIHLYVLLCFRSADTSCLAMLVYVSLSAATATTCRYRSKNKLLQLCTAASHRFKRVYGSGHPERLIMRSCQLWTAFSRNFAPL